MSTKPPVRLIDLFRYYKGLPHQQAAVQMLGELIPPELLGRDTDWFHTWSQDGKQQDYTNDWDGVVAAGKQAGAKFPELVAAQWALESGWGQHTSGKHNYFGLKGSGSSKQTQEFINGQWITITSDFIDFPDLHSCVVYLVDHWHKDYKHYQGCNHAHTRDEAARWLVKEGYATDPGYADKLIKLMNDRAASSPPAERPSTKPPVQQDAIRGNPLVVPWYSQRDSATDEARRMCFSSSCAMLLAYLKPGAITGANADDQYLRRVQQYGDTTDAKAQLHALNSFGVKASFSQKADFKTIENQINRGVPVPCGYLHRGPVTKPSGGGHWLIVVGYTKTHVIVHDPWGEADLITGDTVSSVARYCHYSRENFGRRWMVDGPGSGWAIIATPCY